MMMMKTKTKTKAKAITMTMMRMKMTMMKMISCSFPWHAACLSPLWLIPWANDHSWLLVSVISWSFYGGKCISHRRAFTQSEDVTDLGLTTIPPTSFPTPCEECVSSDYVSHNIDLKVNETSQWLNVTVQWTEVDFDHTASMIWTVYKIC